MKTFIKKKVEELVFGISENLESKEGYKRGETYITYMGRKFHGFATSPADMMENCFMQGNREMVKDVQRFAENILEEQAKEILSCLPEEKEIYNKSEVGVSRTHAVASNQHHGFNTCRSQFLSNLEKKGIKLINQIL